MPMKSSIFRKSLFVFVFLFAIVALPHFVWAAQIKLAWDANTESDLAGYKVYYGSGSRSYGSSIDVGKVTAHTLTGLTEGQTYYIAVTAYNKSYSESGYSNEVRALQQKLHLRFLKLHPPYTT